MIIKFLKSYLILIVAVIGLGILVLITAGNGKFGS